MAISTALVALAACGPESGLPPPQHPLTPTPDAEFRKHAPEAEPRHLLSVPSLSSSVLPNGLKLIVAEDDDMPLVSITWANPLAGSARLSRYALLGELTLATLVQAAKPTMGRDESAIVDIRAHVGPRGTMLMLSGLAETQRQVGEHLRAALVPPHLGAATLDQAKASLIANAATASHLPGSTERFAADVLYGNDDDDLSVGRAERSARDTLEQLSLEQVRGYYRRRYSPASSALIFAGPITLDEATALAQRELGDWRGEPRAVERSEPRTPTPGHRIRRFSSDAAKADRLVVAMPCPSSRSPDYLAFEILTYLLERVPTFELARALRYESGVAYAWNARCLDTTDERTFFIETETALGESPRAMEALLSVFQHLAAGQLTPADLATARANFLADKANAFSSAPGTSKTLAEAYLDELPDNFYERLEARVMALTPEELQRTAQRWLRDAPMAIMAEGRHFSTAGRPLLKDITDRR